MKQQKGRENRIEPTDDPNEFILRVDRWIEPFHVSGTNRSIACWSDLLGFGEQLYSTGWNLDVPSAEGLVKRLENLSGIVHQWHSQNEEVLFINDGIIRTFSPANYKSGDNDTSNVLFWLMKCLVTHCIINQLERTQGLPGVRTVICEGQVRTYSAETFHGDEKEIANRQPGILRPLSTQLNTAFSKCYLADSQGSKAGLKKGGVYVEDAVVSTLIREHEAQLIEDRYVFITGECRMHPVAKYRSQQRLYYINSTDWAHTPLQDDRTSWWELGDQFEIELKGITLGLRELIAFSPMDEFSMFWFDTMSGEGHGYLLDCPHSSDDPVVIPKSPGHEALNDLIASFTSKTDY